MVRPSIYGPFIFAWWSAWSTWRRAAFWWLLLETHAILGVLALFTVVWASNMQPFATCNVRVELRSSSRGMMLCERRTPLCRLRTAAAKVAAYSTSSCFWCRISCVLTVGDCVDLCMMNWLESNMVSIKKLRCGGPNPVSRGKDRRVQSCLQL